MPDDNINEHRKQTQQKRDITLSDRATYMGPPCLRRRLSPSRLEQLALHSVTEQPLIVPAEPPPDYEPLRASVALPKTHTHFNMPPQPIFSCDVYVDHFIVLLQGDERVHPPHTTQKLTNFSGRWKHGRPISTRSRPR
jgi:hypothetical protein